MAGFSAAKPEPFSTQHMGFDDVSDDTTSRFYQMVPVGGRRRVTVEHERDLVLNILSGGFVDVRNAATGTSIPDRLALRGAGKLDIFIDGIGEGRQMIAIQDGLRVLSLLIVSVKTVRRVTYKHWIYTDITTSKPSTIDGVIGKVDTSLKELYKNQTNIEMVPSGAPEELHMGFALREPNPNAPNDKSQDIIFLDHKAHGWKFTADNETGLNDEVRQKPGGKTNDVNFLWTPDIEFSPEKMAAFRIGGSTLDPDAGLNVSIVEIRSDNDINLLRSAHEMCHALLGRIHQGTTHTVQGKSFRYLMEADPVAVQMRAFEIDGVNPSGAKFAP